MFKNPIKTKSWKKILNHFNYLKNIKIIDLFKKDKDRFNKFSINFNNKILIDYSKNKITLETINLFLNLLNEINFKDYITSIFKEKDINFIKKKPFLNFLLRDFDNKLLGDKKYILDYKKDINANLNKIEFFTNKIINGEWLGYSGKKIKNIVNISMGSSDFGLRMIIKSLLKFKINKNQKFYFISDIDSLEISELIKKISPKNTLFIIYSKSFKNIKTLYNANIAKNWILKFYNSNISLNNHFILVSNNFNETIKFGVNLNNIFIIDNWLGKYYSYCSPFGLSISIFMGFKNFKKLLYGAHDMDIHFFNSNYENNIPILLSIISIWYNNFFNYPIEGILVYSNKLFFLPIYLQQLIVEFNNKYINYINNYINKYYISSIILGGINTTYQNSFYKLLYKENCVIPCDFIIEICNSYNINNSHLFLMSNFISQTQFLAFGNKIFKNNIFNKKNNNNIYEFIKFKGNKPSNSILINNIDPYTIGALITLYEYKLIIQNIILNISNSNKWKFDLNRKLSKFIYSYLDKRYLNNNLNKKKIYLDSSTLNLINYFKKNFN